MNGGPVLTFTAHRQHISMHSDWVFKVHCADCSQLQCFAKLLFCMDASVAWLVNYCHYYIHIYGLDLVSAVAKCHVYWPTFIYSRICTPSRCLSLNKLTLLITTMPWTAISSGRSVGLVSVFTVNRWSERLANCCWMSHESRLKRANCRDSASPHTVWG
jgi:hypothetical protein